MDDVPPRVESNSPKFLDRFRLHMRAENLAYSTEKTYVFCAKQFILFHHKKHPELMGPREIEAFLNHLAIDRNVSPNTQKNALNALAYLYKRFLNIDFGELRLRYSKPKQRIPVVFSAQEAQKVISNLSDKYPCFKSWCECCQKPFGY